MSHRSARSTHPAGAADAAAALAEPSQARSGLTEDLLSVLLDALPGAVVIVSDTEVILAANAAACAVLALPRDRLAGTRVAEVLQYGLDYSGARATFLREGSMRGPARVPFADGRVRDMIVEARAHVAPGQHMVILHDDTERQRYQLALRAAGHRFDAVFDGIGDAILVISDENMVCDANAAAAALLGCERPTLLERQIEDLFPDSSGLLKARATLPSGGRVQGRAAALCNGTFIAVDYTLSTQGERGRALLILSKAPDVAPGRAPEGGDLTFRRMFESSLSPTLVCDRDSLRVTAVNQAAVDEYGYSREEFSALSLSDLRPAEDQPHAPCATPRQKPHDQGGLWRQRRRDGSLLDVDITTHVLTYDQGRSELVVSHEASASQLATTRPFSLSIELFEASTQAITIADADVRIIAVNPAFTRLTGYEPSEILGRNPNIVSSGRHDPAFYEAMCDEILGKGHWQGELWDRRKDGEEFPVWITVSTVKNSHGEIVQYMAMFSDISERKAAEARIEYLAHYDQLTALPNRTSLLERFARELSQARRHRRRIGVLFIDLDRFKHVNDTMGHSAGDAVLQETARRLRCCLRQEDFVARQSGDEFIVLITDVKEAHDPAHVAQKIIAAMSSPFEVEGRDLQISPSIGVSLYPDDGAEMETLLKNADVALYQAKSAGRNTYQFYSQAMNASALVHLRMEASLRKALDQGEFLLQYQPQVALARGGVSGVEALIRWRRPELGIAAPAQFVALAEKSGLMVPIGAWVLREACLQAFAWRSEFGRTLRVSVNVTPLQFRQPDFVDRVSEILRLTGIDPNALELEISEAALAHDEDTVLSKLGALRESGIALCIDNFGTGYSSLARLRQFPIDRVKIDQSFVQEIGQDRGAEAMIEAIIGLARCLRVRASAQGVESEEQLAFLRAHGCEDAQGYLFSHPLQAEAVPQQIHRSYAART